MTGKTAKEPLWLGELRSLLGELSQAKVTNFELAEGGSYILVRRGLPAFGALGAREEASLSEEAGVGGRFPLCAPLTGLFYLTPSPQEPPFVTLGDWVQEGQVVALIEAMKVFNEIRAEEAGRVVEIEAVSGELVHEGDVLMILERE